MTAALHGLAAMFDISRPQALFVALLSLLIPLSIFVGRRNVRIRRLRVLDKLGAALAPAAGGALPAGFGLVRARYAEQAGRLEQLGAHLREIGIYAMPTAVFVLLSACGFALVVSLADAWPAAGLVLLQGLGPAGSGTPSFAAATGLVVGAGFVGAYVWSINYLLLRVANFDLTPLSFLSAAAHILLTVLVAWVLRQVMAAPLADAVPVAILLGVAFLSGIYPSLGLNVLVDRLPAWLRLKRDVREAGEIGRSFPLDLIDGIDATIKFRLNGLDIAEVQNLAAANPVELFVETPYGFAQVLDWMAQAQLLAELGPARFLKAREAGVRDMAALLSLRQNPAGLALLGPILGAEDEPEAAARARLDSLAGKLHVRQLQHWWLLLAQALELPAEEPAPAIGAAANLNRGRDAAE